MKAEPIPRAKALRLAARIIPIAAALALFILILGNFPPMDAHDHDLADAPRSFAPAASWLKGYSRTLSGPTIGYHSSYPDATSALIVRATDGTMAIEWETEPVPAGFAEPEATFIWLAGMAAGKGAHRFDLSIDGRPAFAFRTAKDSGDRDWSQAGPDGATLSFRTTLVDQFGELFGFMTLKVPRPRLRPGKPLRLRVTSENGGSPDWHMAFQYELRPFLRARGEGALLKGEAGSAPRQVLYVAVSHIADPIAAEIRLDGKPAEKVRLETGFNLFYLPIGLVTGMGSIQVEVAPEGGDRAAPGFGTVAAAVKPVTPRTLYLIPHSHTDIGYSSHQAKVEADHLAYIDQAVELARKTESYPEGARFKWNSEVLWAVETYLKRTTPDKRQAFITAVKDGSVGLQALLANELTGVCHPEELFELTAYARRLNRDYGLGIDTAMITDIPSYTWSIIPALAQAGIRYFSSGPNYMPNNPDGGDRIGGALRAWGDKPFYWVSPSGREKILFWMAGRGYSWFHGLNMGQLTSGKSQPILDYCRELEDKRYPYEMVQVRYTVGGDNGPPDATLPEVVRRWNETYASPRMVIATAHEMFEAFEKRYGDKLPSVSGDFTPYWEDGAGSTARETAMNRASVVRLVQASTAWSLLDPKGYPDADFREAWRQALLWDEHTWGAADSVSDPDGENARAQWAYKQAFALEADKLSRRLSAAILDREAARDSRFRVLNTLSFERTGVVTVPSGPAALGDRVTDESGRGVPSQRLKDGSLVILAEAVPPLGAKAFTVGPGGPERAGGVSVSGTILDNGRLKATVDPASGTVRSLVWLERGGTELVDATNLPGLNSYHYVPGLDPQAAVGPEPGRVSIGESGPLVASIVVESEAPGCKSLRREYRLTAGSSRLWLIDRLDKTRVREKEAVHIGFPFRVPGATLRFDLGWGWIDPIKDTIAGSCLDFFCPQNAADLSNADWGVTWVTLDAPLAEAGAMTDESRGDRGGRKWRTSLRPASTVFSYALNNYWHTNYKADQEGPIELRYAVEPHAGSGRETAKRIGLDAEAPLLAAAGSSPGGAAPLTLAAPEAVVTSLRPVDGGSALFARVFNASERAVRTGLTLPSGARVYRADADGGRGPALSGALDLRPFEIAGLRLEFGR